MTGEADSLQCAQCGYDLRGIESARCPECGWAIDRAMLRESSIAWTRRRAIGRWRGYWRTVWSATRSFSRIANEVARPVDVREARRFASITALIAGLPLAGAMLFAIWLEGGTGFLNPLPDVHWGKSLTPEYADLIVPYAAGVTLWPVLPLGIFLTVWLIPRVGRTWFARGGEASAQRRQRAAALSYYATAPLAMLPVGMLMWLGGAFQLDAQQRQSGGRGSPLFFGALLTLGFLLVMFCFFWSWVNTLRLVRRTLEPSPPALVFTAIGVVGAWAGCACFGCLIMPWVAGLLWLIVDSVRG